MSRGNCFGLARSKDQVRRFDESDLYEYVNTQFDYVENVDKETSNTLGTNLVFLLSHHGAYVGTEISGGEAVNWFVLTDEVKKSFFKERFKKVQQMMGEIDLEYFSVGDPYTLKSLIDDESDDAVYLADDMTFVSVDRFVRDADTNCKYYVSGQVVLMH